MSRDFDIYCPECQQCHAVRGHITDGELYSIFLLQCRETGKFWVEVRTTKELKMKGATQKDWEKAERWVYFNLKEITQSKE